MTCRKCGNRMKPEDRWVSNQIDLCGNCYVIMGGTPLPEAKRRKPQGAPK